MHLTRLETLLAEHLPALRDLTNDLPRSGTWLLTMYCVVEAADLLDDEAVATDAYDMLRPFADRPVVAGPGAAREAAELGMVPPVRERPRRSRPRRAVCRRQGVGWVVELGHRSARVAELRAASGHSGRSRNFAGNAELARLSVGKAIRRALSRIETANPMVGGHLRASVETGVRCRYHPT